MNSLLSKTCLQQIMVYFEKNINNELGHFFASVFFCICKPMVFSLHWCLFFLISVAVYNSEYFRINFHVSTPNRSYHLQNLAAKFANVNSALSSHLLH